MRRFDFLSSVALAPDGGGSPGGGAPNGGQGGGQGGSAGGTGAQFDPGQFYSKYDLPDGLKGGKSADEAFGKLYEGWRGLRQQVSTFAAPKTPGEYKFEPGEKIKTFFSRADDPMMSLARETAHKLGMPDTHFGPFINGLFTAAAEKGLLPAPFDPAKEVTEIGKLVAPDKQGAELKTAIQAALTEAAAFAPAYADHHKLSPAAKTLLTSLADEAGGIELLRHLKAQNREGGPQLGGEQRQQGYSKTDYDKDVSDPRYNPFNPKYDRTWREGVDAKAKTLFGT